MTRKIRILDTIIKKIWQENVSDDYKRNLILNEDTLKNILYFYLRTCFEKTPELESFCIYTECRQYGFSELNYTPDMIIVDTKSDKIVAIFEFKFKSRNCHHVEDMVYYDFHKMKEYINTLETIHSSCQYYIAAITLGEFTRANWLDGRSKWASGKVAELIAHGPNDNIRFEVVPHNE